MSFGCVLLINRWYGGISASVGGVLEAFPQLPIPGGYYVAIMSIVTSQPSFVQVIKRFAW